MILENVRTMIAWHGEIVADEDWRAWWELVEEMAGDELAQLEEWYEAL